MILVFGHRSVTSSKLAAKMAATLDFAQNSSLSKTVEIENFTACRVTCDITKRCAVFCHYFTL